MSQTNLSVVRVRVRVRVRGLAERIKVILPAPRAANFYLAKTALRASFH